MSNNFRKKGCNSLTFLHISNALLVTAIHLKMKLGDNTLKNERLLQISDKNVANRRPVGCGRKNEGSYNRPYSIHDSHHLCTRLRTHRIKAMSRGFSGGKQVVNFSNTRNRGRVCLFLTTGNGQLFLLKTIIANYGEEVIIFSFLDAAATVDVLTASNNDVNFFETQTYILYDF